MQPELVRFGVDGFDLKDEVPGAGEGFSSEGDSLAGDSWTFWLALFYLDRGPLGKTFPFNQVLPDDLDRGCDDGHEKP